MAQTKKAKRERALARREEELAKLIPRGGKLAPQNRPRAERIQKEINNLRHKIATGAP